MTFDPISRSGNFLKTNIVKKTKLLLHNRKLYVTYGIVLYLVTLTDLQTHCAALSASAEFLVDFVKNVSRTYSIPDKRKHFLVTTNAANVFH